MAIQRGIAERLFFPNAPMRSFKLIELIKYHTIGNLYVAPQLYAMNLKTWNGLPGDVKKVSEDLTLSAGCQAGATPTNKSEWVVAELKKRGDIFYYLSPKERQRWKKAAQPIFDRWIADLKAKGFDGKAIYRKVMALSEEVLSNPHKPDPWWGREGMKD